MANIVLKANRKTPGITSIGNDLESHTRALQAIAEAIAIHERRTKSMLPSFVRVEELIDLGLLTLEGNVLALSDDLGGGGSGIVETIVPGTNITVDDTDPANPIVSATGGGASALDDLTDVDAPNPEAGDVLIWDGYGWVNERLSVGEAETGDPYWDFVVSLLHFEGADGATAVTDDVTRRVWTFNGNAQLDTAQFKFGTSSLLLDGTGDYITTPNNAELQVRALNFTIECWVRLNALPGANSMTIANKRDGGGAEEFSLYINTTAVPGITLFDGSSIGAAESPDALVTGQWYHIAGVRTGGFLYLFVDGVRKATTAISAAAATNTGVLHIGRDGFNTARDLNGWVDEFRFTLGIGRYIHDFNVPTSIFANRRRARTLEDEITADSPMAWWKCDEASGTVLADAAAGTYPLTITGTVAFRRAELMRNREQAFMRIPGNAGTIYARRAGTLGFAQPITSPWTVEAIVRLEEVQSSDNYRIFVIGATGESTATNFQIYVGVDDATGGMFFFWEYGAGGTDFTFSSTKMAIPKGRPVHLVWTKNPTTRVLQCFLDGILIDEGTWTSLQDVTGGTSCSTAIGDEFGTASSGFTVGHVAVYNSILSAERIRAHAVAAGFREA